MMCTIARRALQVAPGSNHGASGQRVRDVQIGQPGDQLVGRAGHLRISVQQRRHRLARLHPEARLVRDVTGRVLRAQARRRRRR